MNVQIYALLFEIEDESAAGTKCLIAWLDATGNGRWCHHAHPTKTLLDVEPGHVIVHKRTPHQVRRVKPYRTSECRDESQYPWIQSGRAYVMGQDQAS